MIVNPAPFTLPDKPLAQVACANGLVFTRWRDELWHSWAGEPMTDAEVAKVAVRVVSEGVEAR